MTLFEDLARSCQDAVAHMEAVAARSTKTIARLSERGKDVKEITAARAEVIRRIEIYSALARAFAAKVASDRERDDEIGSSREAFSSDKTELTPSALRMIYITAARTRSSHIKEQLSYRHMVALSEALIDWASETKISPVQTARFLGMSEGLRKLAEEVGPDWDPPTPESVTILGGAARWLLGEPTPRPRIYH